MASNEDERQWQFYVLQESYAGEWTKKGEKKSFHLLCFEKGEIGGLTFFHLFFNRGIFWEYPNDRAQVQNVHTTFWRREDEKKKVTCNPGLRLLRVR